MHAAAPAVAEVIVHRFIFEQGDGARRYLQFSRIDDDELVCLGQWAGEGKTEGAAVEKIHRSEFVMRPAQMLHHKNTDTLIAQERVAYAEDYGLEFHDGFCGRCHFYC